MHKLFATGNIGQNATIRNGQQADFITFTMAVNKKYTNREGVQVEKTTWYNCIYQPKSTAIAQYLTSGQKVFIEGEPESSLYQDKKGEWKIDNSITVRSIELLGSANQAAPAPAQQAAAPEPTAAPAPTGRNSTGQFVKQPAMAGNDEGDNDLPF